MTPLGSQVIVTLTGVVEGRDEISGNVLVRFETEDGARCEWLTPDTITVIKQEESE